MGSTLGALIKAAGLSREQVAEYVGRSPQTIHNWCSRRAALSPQQLQQVGELLIAHGASQAPIAQLIYEELEHQGLTMGVSMAAKTSWLPSHVGMRDDPSGS